MKRIYQEFSYGKELVGYDYKGYYIEIENELRGMYGASKKWYHIVKKDGQKCCSDRLGEIKEIIESDIKSV